LVDDNRVVRRGNSVHDHLQVGRAQFNAGRNINVGVRRTVIADSHRAVIMRAAIDYVSAGNVGEANQRVVAGVLEVVTVGVVLRGAVEVGSMQDKGRAVGEGQVRQQYGR